MWDPGGTCWKSLQPFSVVFGLLKATHIVFPSILEKCPIFANFSLVEILSAIIAVSLQCVVVLFICNLSLNYWFS